MPFPEGQTQFPVKYGKTKKILTVKGLWINITQRCLFGLLLK